MKRSLVYRMCLDAMFIALYFVLAKITLSFGNLHLTLASLPIMAFFLRRFPRGTAWAIFSFVAGSVVAVLLSFDYAHSSLDGGMIVVGVFSFIVGAIFSFALKRYFDEKAAVEEKA